MDNILIIKNDFSPKKFKKWVGRVHEEPMFDGDLHYMNNSLTHYKNMTVSQMIDKTNKWSEIEAQLMIDAHHPPMNIFRFFTAGLREFILRFVKQKSFLDSKKV